MEENPYQSPLATDTQPGNTKPPIRVRSEIMWLLVLGIIVPPISIDFLTGVFDYDGLPFAVCAWILASVFVASLFSLIAYPAIVVIRRRRDFRRRRG